MTRPRKRLGELVLRTSNAPQLADFYRDVIGLEPFATMGNATFLKVDEDFEGHPQLLAIFEKSWEFSGPKGIRTDEANSGGGTLHHFAFVLNQTDFSREQERMEALGIELQFAEHAPFGWRSIYLHDPDGNSVELVCYDSSILDELANRRVRQSVSE